MKPPGDGVLKFHNHSAFKRVVVDVDNNHHRINLSA